MINKLIALATVLSGGLAGGAAFADCVMGNSSESDFPESLVSTDHVTGIQSTWYDQSTDRYTHGVLGDAIEPSTLTVKDEHDCTHSIVLDQAHVFEDLAPRLADIDKDSVAEVITIRSHRDYGAQIAVYKLTDDKFELLANTPYIGTSNRWLAPIGIADFNNDDDMDIAFIDRPHLAKTLRVWSYRDGRLEQIASKRGHSNHRIGDDYISGGIKTCNGVTSMITADASWKRILKTTLQGSQLNSIDIGPLNNAQRFDNALLCK